MGIPNCDGPEANGDTSMKEENGNQIRMEKIVYKRTLNCNDCDNEKIVFGFEEAVYGNHSDSDKYLFNLGKIFVYRMYNKNTIFLLMCLLPYHNVNNHQDIFLD